MAKDIDAITLLKEDHKKVRKLLKELKDSGDKGNYDRGVFKTIMKEKEVHTKIEEEIFYPAFKEAVKSEEGQELFYESHEEHNLIDYVISKMVGEEDEHIFGALAKLLRELVQMHAEEEEEEMFPLARKHMEKSLLLELGANMTDRKEELNF